MLVHNNFFLLLGGNHKLLVVFLSCFGLFISRSSCWAAWLKKSMIVTAMLFFPPLEGFTAIHVFVMVLDMAGSVAGRIGAHKGICFGGLA